MIALLDNTVLSNFSTVGRPDLVQFALGAAAATVAEAFAELQSGMRSGIVPWHDWSWLPVFALNDQERSTYNELHERLGAGEAACIALAFNRNYRVFTDDRDGRKTAMRMKVPVSGTLGLLVRLIDLKKLSLIEADELLGRMVASGYRSPVTSLAELL